jgi:hypothetical protein
MKLFKVKEEDITGHPWKQNMSSPHDRLYQVVFYKCSVKNSEGEVWSTDEIKVKAGTFGDVEAKLLARIGNKTGAIQIKSIELIEGELIE